MAVDARGAVHVVEPDLSMVCWMVLLVHEFASQLPALNWPLVWHVTVPWPPMFCP